ncbi:hypothetical protein ACUOAQ_30325, partial [Escherichia sp. SP-MK]
MTRLAEILDQMSAVLNDLKTVMVQEQQHLSMGQINGSQLQWITEQKSSLLATLDYLEQLLCKSCCASLISASAILPVSIFSSP